VSRAAAIAAAVLVARAAAAQAPSSPQPAAQPPPPAAPPLAAPAPASRVLTLDEAVQTARERQPQLLQARSTSEAAAARADEARANLLPQVNALAQYQRRKDTVGREPNFYSVGLQASQLVYDFGQTSGRWEAARAGAEAQRDTERATASQIVLNARTFYFNARAQKDLVGVARENLANQDAHLKQTEVFVQLGTRPAIDLAQARTDRANAEVQLINAQNGYATAKAQLNQAIGLDAGTDYDVGDETLAPLAGEDTDGEALLAEALRNRPDVVAADQQVRAQELTVKAARGGYFPALGVSASAAEAGVALDRTAFDWSAGATLSWGIFQGGLTRAQEQEARANLSGAQAQLASVKQQVRVDVEQARLAVRASKAALGAAGEALVNARERLRLAEGRYQTGVGSAIELGDAQVALTTAAAQRVQAEFNLATSRAQLIRALGREVPSV
jgi:outer membrane protein